MDSHWSSLFDGLRALHPDGDGGRRFLRIVCGCSAWADCHHGHGFVGSGYFFHAAYSSHCSHGHSHGHGHFFR